MIESKNQTTGRIALPAVIILFVCVCPTFGGQGSLQLNTRRVQILIE